MNGAGQQTVAFELPQRQGEHPLRDAGDGAVELTEAQSTVAELPDDQDAPLVADDAEDPQHLPAHVLLGLLDERARAAADAERPATTSS